MMLTRGLPAAFVVVLFLGACTVDIGGGSQLAGQRCFQESDCADGLTCHERVCTPFFGGGTGTTDTGNDASNNNSLDMRLPDGGRPDMNPIDMRPPIDLGPCMPGQRRCASTSVVQVCLPDGSVSESRCRDTQVCENGACVDIGPDCRDNDGDGWGPGCPRGFDCDDNNPRINPGMPESCFTSADDNCNGEVNEGCDPNGCCVGGCGPEEFCSQQCVCEPYDPALCERQNQPCVDEGQFVNGFYCIAFNPGNQPRCWGLCDLSAPNPDATCPEPGSVCAFDGGDGQNGICMSPCGMNAAGVQTGCGDPELGCLNVEVDLGDGICVPTNPGNQRGDNCDPDYFFDCAEGLICLQGFQGNRGRCREACRPFHWGGMNTDCDQGHCLAFSADLGVCFNDNNASEGDACGPPQSACNEDAVGCYDGGGGQECLRLCRLDSMVDCPAADQSCMQFDPQQTELGICF